MVTGTADQILQSDLSFGFAFAGELDMDDSGVVWRSHQTTSSAADAACAWLLSV